jgi:Na+-transporting NADH:ubiquinone oxidoreductase subunit C
VALLLCLACSLLVSSSAVGLRNIQDRNKLREKQKNILMAAGLFHPGENSNSEVETLFEQVTPRIIDLGTGEYLPESDYQSILGVKNVNDYDQKLASKDPALSDPVPGSEDIASIKSREKYSFVYLVMEEGDVKLMVLPIRGYGLWSTLWGFVAVDAQTLKQGPEHLTIAGLKYYDQKETPGLGGEVDNPLWLADWPGKHIYDANWNVQIEVTKGGATGEYEVDALSGATITSNGVSNMLKYWFGQDGFRPYLENQSKR